MAKTTRHKPATCPWCGRVNDSATGLNHNKRPKPGDVGVCIGCAELVVYEHDSFRKATDTERAEAMACPDVANVRGAILLYRALGV